MVKFKLNEKNIGVKLLMISIAISLLFLLPLFGTGYNNAGDDMVHSAYEGELEHIILEEKTVYSWTDIFGTGAPMLIHRPPLFYYAVVILHLLTLKMIPLLLAHKLVIITFFTLFPVSVYYLLKKLNFSPIVCGLGAMFALVPVSTLGQTLDAYFLFGVHKQLIAIVLFPIALGKLYGVIHNKERWYFIPVILALIYLAHPYFLYMIMLVIAGYFVLLLVGNKFKETFGQGKKVFLIFFLGILLLSFYMLPFIASEEIKRPGSFTTAPKASFDYKVFTPSEIIINFAKGSLFDSGENIGMKSDYNWPWHKLPGVRPAFFTLFIFLGLITSLIHLKKNNYAFVLTGFFTGFLLMIGPDDIFFLKYLPFQSQFNYIHSVFLLETFAILLGGIGLYFFIKQTTNFITKRFKQKIVPILILVLILSAVFAPLYHERFLASRSRVDLMSFSSFNDEIIPGSELDADYKEMVEILKKEKEQGRVYANNVKESELFYTSNLPVFSGKPNLINPFFAALVGGPGKIVLNKFRKTVDTKYNFLELYNIRYLLRFKASTPLATDSDRSYLNLIETNEHFRFYRVEGEYGYTSFLQQKPFLVYTNEINWEQLNIDWMKYYGELNETDEAIFLVKAKGVKLDESDRYSALLFVDHETNLELKQEFETQGKEVHEYSRKELKLSGLLSDIKTTKSSEVEILNEEDSRNHLSATIQTKGSKFLIYKKTYYRGWKPKIDSEIQYNYRISPGYNGVYVSSGEYELDFEYAGPLYYKSGLLITLLVLALLIYLSRKKNRD